MREAQRDTQPGLGASDSDGGSDGLGRYRLNHKVGKGSMGVVWLGYDPRLDRPVAIKRVRMRGNERTIKETQERLIVEARSLARLSHSNVVGIHDAGVGDDGEMAYIVMEYVPSPPLHVWMESKQPSVEQIIEVLREAGRGLAAAHEIGIVHRDFKPANLLVAKDRSVKVVDFGLALDRGQDPKKRITQIGTSVGTPNYMAPEAMLGYEADHRSDQYSFCVVLYEALYGTRPVSQTDVRKLRDAVIHGELEVPPERPDVPESVRDAIVRGLSKQPKDRFESMDALLDILDEIHRPGRTGRWILVCSVLVLILAATLVYLGGSFGGSNARVETTSPPETPKPAPAPAAVVPVPVDLESELGPNPAAAERPALPEDGDGGERAEPAANPTPRPATPEAETNPREGTPLTPEPVESTLIEPRGEPPAEPVAEPLEPVADEPLQDEGPRPEISKLPADADEPEDREYPKIPEYPKINGNAL